MNNVKTFVLMAGLMGLFLLVGQLLGGSQGLMLALIFGSAFNFIMYFFSDRLVLRMYGAHMVTEAEAPELYRDGGPPAAARRPADAGASPSRRTSSPTRSPPAAIRSTRSSRSRPGILKYMPQEELEGVIAHELAHVKNRDMLISTVAAGIAGAISNLPYLLMFGGGSSDDEGGHPFARLALLLLAPIGAMMIQFAVSRQREFEADRVGAEILGRPMPLANALRRLDAMAHRIPDAGGAGRRAARPGQPAGGPWRRHAQALQHPPADGGAGRAARGAGGGPVVVRPGAPLARRSGSASPALVGALLILDLGVLNRRSHVLSFKEAMSWSLGLIAFALLFGLLHPVARGHASRRWSTTPATSSSSRSASTISSSSS